MRAACERTGLFLLRPQIDHAPRLADRALDRAGRQHFHGGGDADQRLDAVGEIVARGGARRFVRRITRAPPGRSLQQYGRGLFGPLQATRVVIAGDTTRVELPTSNFV